MPAQERQEPGLLDGAAWLDLLSNGEVEVLGRLPYSSNHTLLVRCCPKGEAPAREAVYKPAAGERPLYDFPPATLYRREAAAYVVDQALGWGFVPPTVARDDAPLGPGSLQAFVAHDPGEHYFTLLDGRADRFRRLAAFDILCNNADRKSGHCLLAADGRVWAIDHGLTFHAEPKLRTVIWDFAGEPVPEEDRGAMADLAARLQDGADEFTSQLARLLSGSEIAALKGRARRLARPARFPEPDSAWSFPWPLV